MPVTIGNLAAISILLGGGIVMCVPPPPDDLGDPLTPQEQFFKCSMHSDYPGMEQALARGARVDGRTTNGITALSIAASEGNVVMVRRLLKEGADVNIELPNGLSVLEAAVNGMDDPETIRILLAAGARPAPAAESADRLTAFP